MSAIVDLESTRTLPSTPYFLRLPSEIRLHIYTYCAHNDSTEAAFYSPTRGYHYDPHSFPGPALLQTCRQVFLEAGPILHADVHLHFLQDYGSRLKVRSCGSIVPSAIRNLHLDLDASSCDPAMYFMEAHLGDTSNLRSVYIHWTNRGIPYMRNDAFKRSLLDYLETLKGLRVLVLSGDYGEDFVQHIKQFLAARVIAG